MSQTILCEFRQLCEVELRDLGIIWCIHGNENALPEKNKVRVLRTDT